MITKRIIPCLDIKDGRTVKGINFENIRDAGDPVELAIEYAKQGADELVFLDITATNEKRKTLSELVTRIAKHINIPFTVGGGISSIEDVSALLNAGADKIARERAEKLNEADSMIFQTESQLKELGEKLADDHKVAIELALTELRMAHQNQDLEAIQKGLDNVNAAWKTATEAMYAQGEAGQAQEAQPQAEAQGDNTQDVEFEEVK